MTRNSINKIYKMLILVSVLLPVIIFHAARHFNSARAVPETVPIDDITRSAPIIYQSSPTTSDMANLTLDYQYSIGGDDENFPETIFGHINTLSPSVTGGLLVLDSVFHKVQIYESNLDKPKIFELSQGHGPGEISRPSSLGVCHDTGNIYISDSQTNSISRFDSQMQFINRIQLHAMYPRLLTHFRSEPVLLLHQVNIGSVGLIAIIKSNNNRAVTFGDRQEEFVALWNRNIQAFHNTYAYAYDRGIILVYGYPYEYRKYDYAGNLIWAKRRELSSCNREVDIDQYIFPACVITGVVGNSDMGMFAIFLKYVEEDITWVHFYDMEGRSRGEMAFDPSLMGDLPTVLKSAIVQKNVMVIASNNPYPCINVLKIQEVRN